MKIGNRSKSNNKQDEPKKEKIKHGKGNNDIIEVSSEEDILGLVYIAVI